MWASRHPCACASFEWWVDYFQVFFSDVDDALNNSHDSQTPLQIICKNILISDFKRINNFFEQSFWCVVATRTRWYLMSVSFVYLSNLIYESCLHPARGLTIAKHYPCERYNKMIVIINHHRVVGKICERSTASAELDTKNRERQREVHSSFGIDNGHSKENLSRSSLGMSFLQVNISIILRRRRQRGAQTSTKKV